MFKNHKGNKNYAIAALDTFLATGTKLGLWLQKTDQEAYTLAYDEYLETKNTPPKEK